MYRPFSSLDLPVSRVDWAIAVLKHQYPEFSKNNFKRLVTMISHPQDRDTWKPRVAVVAADVLAMHLDRFEDKPPAKQEV